MRTTKKLLALSLAAAILPGCGGDDKDGRSVVETTQDNSQAKAIFDPTAGDSAFLPFPIDLFFSGTVDGSINIPGKLNSDSEATPVAAAFADPQVALNTMDGFSTTAPLVVRFSGPLNPATLESGISVFESATIDAATKTVTSIERELVQGVDYVATVSQGTTVLIVPVKPLKPGTTHLVVVSNSLETTAGNAVTADDVYLAARAGLTATGLDTQVPVHEGVVEAFTIDNDGPDLIGDIAATDIALSYGVSTQNVGSALVSAKSIAAGASPTIAGSGGVALDAAGPSPQGAASLYAGALVGAPQFMGLDNTSVWEGDPNAWAEATVIGASAAAACAAGFSTITDSDNLVPCNGFVPEVKGTSNLPMLVSVPANADTDCTAADMKVVIYQHGITTSRGTLAALADALASQCAVGVAIDLPKHGILPSDANFGGLSLAALGGERLVPSVAPSVPAPTGSCVAAAPVDVTGGGAYYCPPGDGFINLGNLANSRDTLRQGVADLHSLYAALSNGELAASDVGLSTATISTSDIHFVGMSLGGVVGMPFVAQEPGLVTTTTNVAGGGIARLLDGSASFEPQITAGLAAAAGISKPSADYEAFLLVAQTMVDNTDPVNFAAEIVAAEASPLYWGGNKDSGASSGTARPTLVQEVTGPANNFVECTLNLLDGDANGCPDQTVPNNVFGAAFGPAWGNVSGSGQSGWLPGQNPLSSAAPLAGTDPLVQGTAFLTLNSLGILGDPVDQGDILSGFGLDAFFGMRLQQRGAGGCGPAADCSGVVRFTSGAHSSLLDTSVDLAVTTAMQTQIAGFIASDGALLPADPNAGTAAQVIAD